MIKSTNEIRQMFLDFFQSKGHKVIDSSSLVPDNDTTLLFTNAGMNQFKKIFLCQERVDYTRAVTCQRCIRAGGKHNDLKHVGYTKRHNTFFEMLGNFSFGDYFKKEAILFAWELLTSNKWFNIPKNRLFVTVYISDSETYNIWANDIGIPNNRIIKVGDQQGIPYLSDNFWQMGDTGPCGPCTEIIYDYRNLSSDLFNIDLTLHNNDYLELWNIVFLQFDRQSDGIMLPLFKPSIDTGMGLERITSVIQNVRSNYEIDFFKKLIDKIAQLIGIQDIHNNSLKVIADHIRSSVFLIADGVLPSNENRGYVLRRIIRRAIRHGKKLGAKKSFFYLLVKPFIEIINTKPNDLSNKQTQIEKVLKFEEEQFAKIFQRGRSLLNEKLSNLQGKTLNGEFVFYLHDTFGFPVDCTKDICKERNVTIDMSCFEKAMLSQQSRARKSNQFEFHRNNLMNYNIESSFIGYEQLNSLSVIKLIYVLDEKVENISTNMQNAIIILDKTPFYGESGGQIGDIGILIKQNAKFVINDTKKYGNLTYHIGILLSGNLSIGDICETMVDTTYRRLISLNHSATHMLHSALCKVLGNHILQKGSFISDSYFRFDFLHHSALKKNEINKIEEIINEQIYCNLPVITKTTNLEEAKIQGAKMLFKQKYSKNVRVVRIGSFSTELCGGTHAVSTGEIGLCFIRSESGIASSIRRIEGITSKAVLNQINIYKNTLHNISDKMKTNVENLDQKIESLIQKSNILEKQIDQLLNEKASNDSKILINNAINIEGIKLLVNKIENTTPSMMNNIILQLRHQLHSSIIVLATVTQSKILLIASVTKDLTSRFPAHELIYYLAKQIDGKGGGKSDLARAGGKNIKALKDTLSSIKSWVYNRL
ncbi:alanine--tRNA ligase [Candidatus Pantoea edessiphila]|uniref:Alanine--tRNA ligase n=1 Tax=Candidatus Pantoea edessiphila TaxID=2044610 RepID=A0A2P5SVP9_9GAMM|nr:alanine--tRNA ligase [Candidatus Pantoea edessiphila]PPI86380.1 alanine--tRNA ligase [Candidatus Pantoea edessiphila]